MGSGWRYATRMLTQRDHHVQDLFDPWEHLGPKRRKLLQRSWAGVFREQLLPHLPVRELASHLSAGMGRPSKDLHMVVGALVLQQLHDLTDEQAVEAVALNIAWHYALDIRREADAYLCERTLRNYRRKIIDLGLEGVLFRTLTDQLIAAVGLDTSKQRLDSTAVRSAIRSLTRLGILVEATSKFLRELKRVMPDRFADVDPLLIEKYVKRSGEGCFGDTRPSESKRRLPEAAQDIFGLIETFRVTPAAELESFRLLNQVFHEQCEVVSGNDTPVRVKLPSEMPCDNILSPADPDARFNKRRGAGYLVQLMETYSQDEPQDEDETTPPKPDLITHVAVGKMNTHDRTAVEPALDDTRERDVKPDQVLADSHYGSNECLEMGAHRNVEIVSPSMPPKGRQQGRLTLEDFELDENGYVIHCPQGHAPLETSGGSEKLQVLFDQDACQRCPLRTRCPASAVGRRSQRYQYTPARVRQRERRLKEATEEFRDRYRWRAGVEATVSRFKHQMNMAKLRVRGQASVTYTAVLRALGLNIRRVAAYQAAIPAH